ncbi:MAG: hypothetical protein GFH27_549283n402 [Chloroflexi bacterium AL-W]|nr:hypothetical protein [Chloroflexi bacterium AL-N1]NOK64477.1 hypothetical protein [Chloroflexi bacterium AL-N10]NOK75719.1 hypothetical protein [Chloroflexi bacterium AL-N5]NOK80523.1 hypothetical protein [Chloroflexi bacterium AL-W]NOK87037.1 hypothetical protein [Chloroflexi bacterium AL-N15]
MSILSSFQRGIALLFQSGHGSAFFVVDDHNELQHVETVQTVKRREGETVNDFGRRLVCDFSLEPGDQVEFLVKDNQVNIARLTYHSRSDES